MFPFLKCYFWKNADGSHFHGVALDIALDRTWQVNRGTDGDRFIGKLHAWLYNLNVFAKVKGVHPGFKKLGDLAFGLSNFYLGKSREVICVGDSAGAAVAPYIAVRVVDELRNEMTDSALRVKFVTFSAVPTGTAEFARHVNELTSRDLLKGRRFVMPGDPANSEFLRRHKSLLLNGVDVGQSVRLPDINLYDGFSPVALINHSPAQINASLNLWLDADDCAFLPRAVREACHQALHVNSYLITN